MNCEACAQAVNPATRPATCRVSFWSRDTLPVVERLVFCEYHAERFRLNWIANGNSLSVVETEKL